jgi:deoxyhypusine monooxygenase
VRSSLLRNKKVSSLKYKIDHCLISTAEALGAIGKSGVVATLKEYADDDTTSVAETCQLALRRLEWIESGNSGEKDAFFGSVDPTPASGETNLDSLRQQLLSDSTNLYERYRALFALRNINSPEAIQIICDGKKYKFLTKTYILLD